MTGADVSRPGTRRPHVMVIAYYFPPMALSGVQRVTKFVKYLAEFGWRITVLTARPGSYFAFDDTLEDDLRSDHITIVRTGSLDPTRLFGARRTVRLPSDRRRKRLTGLSQWVFIPDNKIGWYPLAVRAAMRLHDNLPIDIVFASAPPYTTHLVAQKVAKRIGVPLVTDFRDDWVGNPRHVYPTGLHRRIHEALERKTVAASSRVCVVNPPIAHNLRSRAVKQGLNPAITILPQGYDPADFDDHPRDPSSRMCLLYAGVFYDAQSPEPFLRGLARCLHSNPGMRSAVTARFAGLVPDTFESLVKELELQDVVEYVGYVPHTDVARMLQNADVLWMTVGRRAGSEGISTGKLFEYFGSRRPILGLVPDGTARDHLSEYGAAVTVAPDDLDGIGEAIAALQGRWVDGSLPMPDEMFVRRFDRRRLTRKLIEVFDGVMEGVE